MLYGFFTVTQIITRPRTDERTRSTLNRCPTTLETRARTRTAGCKHQGQGRSTVRHPAVCAEVILNTRRRRRIASRTHRAAASGHRRGWPLQATTLARNSSRPLADVDHDPSTQPNAAECRLGVGHGREARGRELVDLVRVRVRARARARVGARAGVRRVESW